MEIIKFALTSCAGWAAILATVGLIWWACEFCREEIEYRRVRKMLLSKKPDRAG